jgi:multiple sugar transport system ATP-binding protein
VEHLGDQTRLHLTVAGHDIVTLTDAHTDLGAGDTVSVAPHAPLYFDMAGARIA